MTSNRLSVIKRSEFLIARREMMGFNIMKCELEEIFPKINDGSRRLLQDRFKV